MEVRAAQLPRPPQGADRIIVSRDTAAVLDGASAFAPDPDAISPGRYADELGVSIVSGLTANHDAPLSTILADAIRVTATALGLHSDDGPSSTVAISRVTGDTVDLLALGDSYLIYRTDHGTSVLTDDRLGELPVSERGRYRNRLLSGAGYDATHTAIVRELQASQREYRNRPGGYWIASADPAAASHAITVTLPATTVSWIILASDGVVSTAQHLHLDDWEAIAHFDTAGLRNVLERCHEWEERTDPDGQRLPRAKRHDDKTIASILLR